MKKLNSFDMCFNMTLDIDLKIKHRLTVANKTNLKSVSDIT